MATSTAVKPPTSMIGHTDQYSQWGMIISDFAETIGDVMWPTSVWTYSQMRHDPRLAAILAAYTLPIRRATWTVDPTGCRDEVVQLVSDDLGIPVLGDDRPGPARMRGVSWNQHVRLALLNLVFGHMGFELAGEINALGQFRLTDLAERMPNSISQIHTDKRTSGFAGISQWTIPGQNEAPDIPASRMAWYTHEREGSQWQGRSMLRPAYAPWLLKREMQRVHATSNRRFGMGVPVVRALPGTNPTPAQFQAAQEIAQSMRAGDQAGAALPPGFIIELVGLSGSVPDTPAFLDWLNGEMSTSTLTQFMDLGRTETGSRALGNVFVDYFLLSDQAVADELADTATRGIAGKLVGWNWGEDEPVPRITVADIGSRHEVTAEAIGLLLTSGAIAPDPELERFVRGEFGFPQRSAPAPAQPPAVPPVNPPVNAGVPFVDRTAEILRYVQARPAGVRAAEVEQHYGATARKTLARLVDAKRLARAARGVYVPIAAAGTSGQSGLSRDLTDIELASGVDFAAIQTNWDAAKAQLLAEWPSQAGPIRDELVAAVAAAIATGDLAALGALTASSAALAAAIATVMQDTASSSAAGVVAEAASQGVTITAPVIELALVSGAAAAIAGVIVGGLASAAARAALQNAAPDADPAVVGQAAADALDAMTASADGWIADNLGQAVTVAQSTGRSAALAAAPAATYYASEVMDHNTCDPCYDVDGKKFVSLALAQAEYALGGYANCQGGLRCRGMIIARWES